MPSIPKVVLGISFGHGDSSAALIQNGVLVAAAEEERFNRIKHYALFPEHAVRYCLQHAGIPPSAVEIVAVGKSPFNLFWKKVSLALRHPHLLTKKKQQDKNLKSESLSQFLRRMDLQGASVFKCEHHLAHLMSARYLEPESDMALLSFDGLGDFVSAAGAKACGDKTDILERVLFPHSLGFFYTAMTQYLGFPYFGDEFKVMGLSSLGKPKFLTPLRELVRESKGFGFTLNLEAFPILKKPFTFSVENAQPKVSTMYNTSFLTHIVGLPPRKPTDPLTQAHSDLAKSVQMRFEEVANHLLRELHKKVPSDILGLAGGCAHNSVWVGKIPAHSPFKKILVAPASHDAGLAVGAAVLAARTPVTAEGGHWALLGPDHSTAQNPIPEDLQTGFEAKAYPSTSKLIQWMVETLSQGKIVGLFHGRMEFGPRALGSRSILADPRDKEMKDKLNERVKHRETFRPFAASVLEEYQDEWFKDAFSSPTMEAVFEVREKKRKSIPAVVHVDHSCRIQSVRKETQSFYWQLIEAFRKKTGIPMLLNTSFNDCEPIVCTQQDALNCFAHCDMDYLVFGETVYSRKKEPIAIAM